MHHLCLRVEHHICASLLCPPSVHRTRAHHSTTPVHHSCAPHLSNSCVCTTPVHHICPHLCAPSLRHSWASHLCAELRLASGVRVACGSWKRLGLQPGLRTPPSAPSPGLVRVGGACPSTMSLSGGSGLLGLWKCQLRLGG